MAAVQAAEHAEAAGRATEAATPAAPREPPKVDGARDNAIRFSGVFLGRPPSFTAAPEVRTRLRHPFPLPLTL